MYSLYISGLYFDECFCKKKFLKTRKKFNLPAFTNDMLNILFDYPTAWKKNINYFANIASGSTFFGTLYPVI